MVAPKSLLILGDSTALGVGSELYKNTVPGRLAQYWHYPFLNNFAMTGATLADVIRYQLPLVNGDAKPEVVMLMAGGNDVIKASARRTIFQNMKTLLAVLKTRAPQLIVVTPGNVGHAPRWFQPLKTWFAYRSHVAHRAWCAAIQASQSSAAPEQIIHVDMAAIPLAQDPFLAEPQRYYSADGVHPNDAGYGVWYRRIVLAWKAVMTPNLIRSFFPQI